MNKKPKRLSPSETKTLLLKNAKKLMSKNYKVKGDELVGEKK